MPFKKNTFILLCFLVQGLVTHAQAYKTAIGVNLRFANTNTYQIMTYDLESRGSFEGGIEIAHHLLTDQLQLRTGISFYNRGYREWYDVYDLYDHLIGADFQDFYARYIGIPLTIVHKRKYFYFGYGPHISYHISSTNTDLSGSQRLGLGGQVLTGVEFKLGNRLCMGIEAYTNAGLANNYINFGLGIGLKRILTSP